LLTPTKGGSHVPGGEELDQICIHHPFCFLQTVKIKRKDT